MNPTSLPTLRGSFSWLCAGLALLALTLTSSAHADSGVSQRITEAQIALDEWRLDDAARIAAELQRTLPDVPPVEALVGQVKFYQGDFEGAVAHLKRAKEGGITPPLLPLAERTRNETAGSVTQESAHFVVRVPRGKDEVLLPLALDALEKAYAALTVAFDFRPTHKIAVDILHDAKGLAQVSTLTEKEIETSGTIALCKYNRLMATSPKALARGYAWLDTLSHELVHLMVSSKSNNNTPVWLHEGLAKYNETRWRGAPGLALEPSSENLLAAAVKKNTLITFDAMHPSMAKLPSQEDAALAFAEVFTVIEMIERDFPEGGGGKRSTTVLLEALATGQSMDAALVAATGQPLKELEATWRSYLKRRAFKLVPGAAPKKLTFVKNARKKGSDAEAEEDEAAFSTQNNKTARKHVRLANLLRNKRRLTAAALEYEKARAAGAQTSPALNNRLAAIYLEASDLARAKPILQDTARIYPDDPQTHVLLGRLAVREKDYASAKQHVEMIFRENPFHPEAWMLMYAAAEGQNDNTQKAKAQHAITLLMQGQKEEPFTFRARPDEPGGTLSLTSEPWGRVTIDGVDTGLYTPVVDLRLKPGPHRVRVTDSQSGREQGEQITLAEGQALRLHVQLVTLSAEAKAALLAHERPQLPAVLTPAPKNAPQAEKAPWEDDDDNVADPALDLERGAPFLPR